MLRYVKICLLILVSSTQCVLSQDHKWFDLFELQTEVATSVSSNSDLNPLWLYSQEWGKYTQYRQGEALIYLKGKVRVANYKYFTMNAGLGLIGKTEFRKSMIHEAYLSGRLFIFDYTAGMEAKSPLAKYDRMTSGNYLMSSNARPTPRIGLGLMRFWSVPFTHDWLQIKGALYLGKLLNEYDANDKYASQYTRDVIFHEKFAYARIGGLRIVKPYLGLVHSVMMGGKMADGDEIPIDMWASFLGKGSDKFTGKFRGESTNAAGAHQGMWDAGVDFDANALYGTVYLKRPFADATGKMINDDRSKDFYIGSVVNLRNTLHLKSIGVEWVRTDWQGGEGKPDPSGYDDYGNYLTLFPGDLPKNSLKDWFESHFNSETLEHFRIISGGHDAFESMAYAYDFFVDHWNHGWYHGGRSNCLSNYFYPQGWASGNMLMSSAYFHTRKMTETYGNNANWSVQNSACGNYRINALTIAVNTSINSQLSIFSKFGITKNQGNLVDKYKSVYSWEHVPDYYFDNAKMEYYLMFDASYCCNNGFIYKARLAADWGDLYNSYGLRVSAAYNFSHFRW